jgi:hypothetical protein
MSDTTPRASERMSPALAEALTVEEFKALRATIRERGTARVIVALITFVTWAVLVMTTGLTTHPMLSLVPLLVLEAGFESVLSLHVGAERVGRYLRIYYEASADAPKWETVIAAFGRTPAAHGSGLDALFAWTFVIAALFNGALAFWTIWLGSSEIIVEPGFWGVVVAHVAFLFRVAAGRQYAHHQRRADAAAFESVRSGR